MTSNEQISFSRSGKPADVQMYALCAAPSREELERWATMLWYSLRSKQRESGEKETAAIWIGNKRFTPTKEQIEEYEERVRKILAAEAFFKEEPDVEEGSEEQPDEADGPEEDVEGSVTVPDVFDDEEEEEAEAGDADADEQVTSITLDVEDDLDF